MDDADPIWQQDVLAIEQTASVTDISAPLLVEHFIYVPSGDSAAGLSEELKDLGFRTDWGRAAQGDSWLVQATHRIVLTPDALKTTRLMLEKMAAKVRGEYDGWGVPIPRDRRQ